MNVSCFAPMSESEKEKKGKDIEIPFKISQDEQQFFPEGKQNKKTKKTTQTNSQLHALCRLKAGLPSAY